MSPRPMHGERLLTIEEAAQLLNASSRTVRRRIEAGEMPAIRDGRIVRVHPEDLRRYIASRRNSWPPTSSRVT